MPRLFEIKVNGQTYRVEVEELPVVGPSPLPPPLSVPATPVRAAPAPTKAPVAPAAAPSARGPAAPGAITAQMASIVVKVLVTVGQKVTRGTPLLVIEAMKMETPVPATDPGTVQAVLVKAGDRVEVGQELVRIG